MPVYRNTISSNNPSIKQISITVEYEVDENEQNNNVTAMGHEFPPPYLRNFRPSPPIQLPACLRSSLDDESSANERKRRSSSVPRLEDPPNKCSKSSFVYSVDVEAKEAELPPEADNIK